MKPMPANPRIIMAQLEGSGTAVITPVTGAELPGARRLISFTVRKPLPPLNVKACGVLSKSIVIPVDDEFTTVPDKLAVTNSPAGVVEGTVKETKRLNVSPV